MDELHTARLRLAELGTKKALLALEEAGLREAPAHKVARLEQIYAQELAAYGAAMQCEPHVSPLVAAANDAQQIDPLVI
jgi:hypothetical protein